MSLELLSTALGQRMHFSAGQARLRKLCAFHVTGISVFAEQLANRNVIIYSDNTGAEAATRKGSTVCFDHCALVHGMWRRFAELRCGVWVTRVPSVENIADPPSR